MQASRARLTEALTAAGLKTQAALAERIADLEALESAPRDMVSRAFRELPVEPTSLERIARALEVPAHTFYKTADELAAETPASNPPPSRRRRAWGFAGLAVAAIVAMLVWWVVPERSEVATPASTPAAPLSLGKLHVVVMPVSGDDDGRIASALRQFLEQNHKVASATAMAAVNDSNVKQVADTLRADVVIDGELALQGRLAGLTLFAYVDGVRQQIWAESFATVDLPVLPEAFAARAGRALGWMLQPGEKPVAYFPLAPVLQDYLAGEHLLDQPANELNLKRAQSRFEAALRQDGNFALAHAGLCEALLEQHWMFEEDRMLRDASSACSQALLLDPDHPVVASAHAHFLSRTGRNDEAIVMYESVNAAHPSHAAAFEGLAAALLDGYRQSADETLLARAKVAARRAADVDPTIWKPLFNLASMEWFSGNNAAAIAVSEEALLRQENEYLLGNLGTFYICRGSFDRARAAYTRAQEIAPQSYVGDEFLGMTHYFLGNYDEAVRLRRRAIASIGDGAPEIHEMWGQLADSLRMSGAQDEAVAAYQRAAAIAERDYLQGTAPVADRAARAYYYTALEQLQPGSVPAHIEDALNGELDEIAAAVVEATAHRRMAQIWVMRGELGKARAAVARATTNCPGYGMLPDFAALSASR